METIEDRAFDEVTSFQRCPNFPRDPKGVKALAKGLIRASEITGVAMEAIVARCAESSEYCPTDFDLLAAARAVAPNKPENVTRTCPHGTCDGSGWVQAFALHTHHSNPTYVEKTAISGEEYDRLKSKVDWRTQMVYEARKRCQCHPPRPDEVEKRGRYA